MDCPITKENLNDFCYTNDNFLIRPVRGIVVDFFGLGYNTMLRDDTDSLAARLGKHGILYVFPYNNPWCWMNPQAIQMTDTILELCREKYFLPPDYRLVAHGGSMGGHSALVYTRYGSHTPVSCVANCPVCDLPYHYTERTDLPRTLYSAFFHEEGEIEDVLKRFSPFHLALAGSMPKMVSYHVFHCTADKAVNKEMHSDRFVTAMEASGNKVDYIAVPDRGHCELTPEMKEKCFAILLKAFEK